METNSTPKTELYQWQGMTLPEHLQESLDAYARDGRPTGGFLRACLANDLVEAALSADDVNMKLLPIITVYIINHIPFKMRGNEAKIRAWIQEKAEERQRQSGGE